MVQCPSFREWSGTSIITITITIITLLPAVSQSNHGYGFKVCRCKINNHQW